ncbi:MAG: hypothetical protein ACPGVG_18400 [Mycobacterium sp.]
MAELTRELAASKPAVLPVRLNDSITGHVRRLPGSSLPAFVRAIRMPLDRRAACMVALCACTSDGVPMFDEVGQQIEDEVATWPPVWLLKLSDAAGEVNGLDLEPDDPPAEPGA